MEFKNIKITKRLLKDIWLETLRGKTIDRILVNYVLRSIKVSGHILDLGSSDKIASYHRFINYQKPYDIQYTDLYKRTDRPDIITLDLERKFPLKDEQFDAITCFNVLEHIYDYQNLISEAHRILKDQGILLGSVPFLVNYHADPNDYWRYTWQALEKVFKDNHFQIEKFFSISFGPFTAGFLQIDAVIPKIIKPFFHYFNLFLDRIILKYKSKFKDKYVLGYLFVLKK